MGFADHDHEAQVEAGDQGTQDEYYEYSVQAGHETESSEQLDIGASQKPFFVDGSGKEGKDQHYAQAAGHTQEGIPDRMHAVCGDAPGKETEAGDNEKHDELIGDYHVFDICDGHLKKEPQGKHDGYGRPGVLQPEVDGERDKDACKGILVWNGSDPLSGGVEEFFRRLLSIVREPPAGDVIEKVYGSVSQYGAGCDGSRACDDYLKYRCHG